MDSRGVGLAAGTAKLEVISYEILLSHDPREAQRLLSACETWGFFYLYLGGDCNKQFLQLVQELFDISCDYFKKPVEEKLQDTREQWDVFNICGYKPMALDTGNVESKKDGCEGLRIPLDLVFSPGTRPELTHPNGIAAKWDVFDRYIRASHDMSTTLLSNLSDSLDLKDQDRFEVKHQANSSSTSTAVLQHYPRKDLPANVSVGHFTHTDTGSITILFNTEWGLQIYSPSQQRWEYVAPKQDHAIVNVGDALKFMSHLRLKSCLHRVVPHVNNWTSNSRYALIFFLRPNDDAEFTDLEGRHWTAGEWLNSKFLNYRSSLSTQRQTTMATGKKGFVGVWNAANPCEEAEQVVTSI